MLVYGILHLIMKQISTLIILFCCTISSFTDELYKSTYYIEPGTFSSVCEGPVCDINGNLYVCNMLENNILDKTYRKSKRGNIAVVKPDGTVSKLVDLPKGCRGNGMRINKNGDLLIANNLYGTILCVNIELRTVNVYAELEPSARPNDLAIHSDGTLFVSDWRWGKKEKVGIGGLWKISPSKKVTKIFEGCPNGIEISPDETKFYLSTTVYELKKDKTLGKKLYDLVPPEGDLSWFDGMRADNEGNIYLARFGKNKKNGVVHKFNSIGDYLFSIQMHSGGVTNIAFGGIDGKTIYVTTRGHNEKIKSFGAIEKFRVDVFGRNTTLLQSYKK